MNCHEKVTPVCVCFNTKNVQPNHFILFKKRNTYLCCFKIDVKKFCQKSSSSNFILQLIQVKVYNFNTLLIRENVQSLCILLLRETHISGGRGRRGSSSRINNCPASRRHGLGRVLNHLHWDGRPPLLECLK